jgi:hypothetical protein
MSTPDSSPFARPSQLKVVSLKTPAFSITDRPLCVRHDTTESGVKHQTLNSYRIKFLNYLSPVDIIYDDHFTTSQMGSNRK